MSFIVRVIAIIIIAVFCGESPAREVSLTVNIYRVLVRYRYRENVPICGLVPIFGPSGGITLHRRFMNNFSNFLINLMFSVNF